jgi:hypothetical protein
VGILLAFGVVLATAWPAFAQRGASAREPRRFYLSATAFGDIERVTRDSSDNLNGQTVGVGVGIGTFVTRRWSLEFEASMPRTIDGRLQSRTYQEVPPTRFVDVRYQTQHRTDTGTVLLGFHPSRRGRVQVAYSAGVSFVRFRYVYSEDDTTRDTSTGASSTRHSGARESYFTLGFVLQIEASVRLTRRLAVVPYFRAFAFAPFEYQGAFVFRPGAALRIHF